jgi:hypothetical protein
VVRSDHRDAPRALARASSRVSSGGRSAGRLVRASAVAGVRDGVGARAGVLLCRLFGALRERPGRVLASPGRCSLERRAAAAGNDEVGNPRGAGTLRFQILEPGAQPRSPQGKTLRCTPRGLRTPVRRCAGAARGKHARGGAGKPAPRRREGEPQRGERQEGIRYAPASVGSYRLSGGIKPSKPTARPRSRPTAGKERARRRVRISGGSKALKAEAQERCRGETDPAGSVGALAGAERDDLGWRERSPPERCGSLKA